MGNPIYEPSPLRASFKNQLAIEYNLDGKIEAFDGNDGQSR